MRLPGGLAGLAGGGYNDAFDWMVQEVTIPAQATRATLKFMYAINTKEEVTDPTIYDKLTVWVTRTADFSDTKFLLTLSNLDATPFWKQSPTMVIPSHFFGEPIWVEFYGITDESYITSFFIDNVVLGLETTQAFLSEKTYLPLILKR